MPNGIKDNLFRYWGHTSTSAIEEWNETIPSSTGQVAEAILSEADVQSRARAGATSSNPTRTNNTIGDARLASRVKEAIISTAGLEDPEHPSNAGIGTQSRLTDLTAALALEHLNDHLRATNQHADVELPRDLRDPGPDHGWMWALASADASTMTSREFALAVKLRIGADVAVRGSKCSRCDMAMDRRDRHALVCQGDRGVHEGAQPHP